MLTFLSFKPQKQDKVLAVKGHRSLKSEDVMVNPVLDCCKVLTLDCPLLNVRADTYIPLCMEVK